YSCGSGSLTFTTISADLASAAVGTMVAPAAVYAASERPLPSPADFSTSTLWPRATRLFTPAGVIPTRFSRVLISLGTPMITGGSFLRVSGRHFDGAEHERRVDAAVVSKRARVRESESHGRAGRRALNRVRAVAAERDERVIGEVAVPRDRLADFDVDAIGRVLRRGRGRRSVDDRRARGHVGVGRAAVDHGRVASGVLAAAAAAAARGHERGASDPEDQALLLHGAMMPAPARQRKRSIAALVRAREAAS